VSVSKSPNCPRPSDSCNFDNLWKPHEFLCFIQISWETILLPHLWVQFVKIMTRFFSHFQKIFPFMFLKIFQHLSWILFMHMFTSSLLYKKPRPKAAPYYFGRVSTFHTRISTAWCHKVEHDFFISALCHDKFEYFFFFKTRCWKDITILQLGISQWKIMNLLNK
jgi:hypothetical protein